MATIPLFVQSIIVQLTNGRQVTPANSAIMALATIAVTFQFIGQNDVTYDDYLDNPVFLLFKPRLEFDFIIVGTGSGGSAMAGRLCEVNNWQVLSIEAGDNPILNTEVPKFFTHAWRSPNDWNYTSIEKRACLSQFGVCYLPRGCMVGGCASINVMFFVRGAYAEYDLWETKFNCTGWGFKGVLPYFKKFEGNRHNWGNDYHNQTGKVCIDFYEKAPYINFFAKAGAEMGYPTISDINGPENPYTNPAYCEIQGTVCNGRRSGTNKAYIIPLKRKSNFKLIKNAIVTKILFNGNRAIGVEFVRYGITYKAYARKEVIVSAGAYGSPILLQLSGIGDPAILKKNQIPVVASSPQVGKNMADHVCVYMWYSFPLIQDYMSVPEVGRNITLYYRNPRAGYFAQISTLPTIGFLNTTVGGLAHIECFHYLFFKNSVELPEFLRTMFYKDAVNKAILAANNIGAVALVMPSLLNPLSRGHCLLNGTKGVEAFKELPIFMNYYSDSKDEDRNIMIKAVKDQRAREKTETYQSVNASLIRMPDCFNFDLDSDEFYNCFIDQFSASIWHPAGTCQMGPDPATAVVGTDCKVHGVANVRVVDVSITPKLPWGNTNSPGIMIGEKCADLLKKSYGVTIGVTS
ncbi:glucose dehydrogenase [FAD, quinone]-like [Contarinia nasturtii]|uniref:glucose dehydrogenase [FAD, quinone]-like n=1 Tax=Contarinia nasturtii TaxID=265458 RepID=UPI0012D445ED|nr:glucose dehydrogenase [FAD, quinone]-like [Contarinia nasturtii]